MTETPRIGEGPGFDYQGSVTLFLKYCFPNLHWIHDNALGVEDCEFVPVHHQLMLMTLDDIWWHLMVTLGDNAISKEKRQDVSAMCYIVTSIYHFYLLLQFQIQIATDFTMFISQYKILKEN